MNSVTAYDLYEPFKEVCETHFRLLQEDYGCRLVEVSESVYEISATYANATTGINVSLEPREKEILVTLIQLVDGELVPYHLAPSRWLYAHTLLNRVGGRSIEYQVTAPSMTVHDLERILSEYAEAMRGYADDILRGDFSVLIEVNTILLRQWKEKVQRRSDMPP